MARARVTMKAGGGAFVVPPQGRPAKGALPGESKEGRDQRVLAYIRAHPGLDNVQIAAALKVPQECVRAQRHQLKIFDREARERANAKPQFSPPCPKFRPSPPLPETAGERIATISPEERERIAAQYGAVFR